MRTKLLFVSLITFFASWAAQADICSTVISGASLEGYRGRMGGYDAKGLCHIRDITEDPCRRLSGNLFYGYTPDLGKGFAHCAFWPPSASGGSARTSAPSTSRTTELCNEAVQDFQTAWNNFDFKNTSVLSVDSILKDKAVSVDVNCRRAGKYNTGHWALAKYGEAFQHAKTRDSQREAQDRVRTDEGRKKQNDISTDEWMQKMNELTNPSGSTANSCNPNPSETAWCKSTAPNIRRLKGCFDSPVHTGSGVWSIKMSLVCAVPAAMAVIATYSPTGECTRQVVSVTTKNPTDPTITSEPKYGTPRVIDEIVAETPNHNANQLWKCYSTRHQNCPCN